MKANKLAIALAISVGGGLLLSVPLSAIAAGNVDTANGDASVQSPGGIPRALAKGDRVVEGDTVTTGTNGSVLITTDDSGVLAVRPRSRLIIDAYKVNGNDQDSVVLNLLRGSLRSITGWISKTAPKNYRVTTNTATIGIRGTDHEVAISEGADSQDGKSVDDVGTWNQVTEGATTLATGNSSGNLLEQKAGTASAVGRVKAAGQPVVEAIAPATLFAPQPTDARNAELKKDAQTNQQQRLDTRKLQAAASGGTSAQNNPKVSSQCTPNSPAQKAFDELIRAYEQGDIAFLQSRLSPSMVGYSALINDVLNSTKTQRQTRIQVKDRQLQCGADVSVVNFSWEKTFLDSVSFQPGIVRGQASMVITGLSTGNWQVGGMAGNLPFTPVAPTLTQSQSPTPTPTPVPGPTPGLGTIGTVSTSVPSISVASNPSGCGGPPSVNINVSANSPIGPRYSVQQFVPTAPTCVATPQTAAALTCQLNITGLPIGNGTVAATAVPADPSTTTCNITYSNGAGGVVVVGGGAVPLSLIVNSPITFPGVPGSIVAVSAPLVYRGTASQQLGTASVSTVAVQTGVGVCKANIQLPPASAYPQTCEPASSLLNVSIQVQDADLMAPSMQVQVGTSNGDTEVFTLPQISPGVYRLTQLPITRGGLTVLPGNGSIDIPASNAAPIILTVKYTDATSPTGSNVVRQTTLQLLPYRIK